MASLVIAAAAPSSAETQARSNRSIWQVRQRLENNIIMLQHDARDYGGHRVAAVNDLQAARNELLAAEQAEHGQPVNTQEEQPATQPGERSQKASDRNLRKVRRNVEHLIGKLEQARSDYGGHRVAAIHDMHEATGELTAAEQFAKTHGY